MPATSSLKDIIHASVEEEIAFLAELVKVPSDNPPGDCAAHAHRAAQLLEAMGFAVERHRVSDDLVRAHGMISATNLVVRHKFGEGPVIALNSHGDVVAPGEGWTHDPYGAQVVDGWMFGRGVAVSKSDFATYAFALRALVRSGLQLNGTVELHFTYDEEAGGEIGPGWLLAQGISKPDMAISAAFSYAVIVAHNGCLHLEVEVTGKSAHAAIPASGIDAFEAGNHILSALYACRRTMGGLVSAVKGIGSPQLNIGLIKGGINTNVVPDKMIFRLDRRMVPEENPKLVEEELREVIARAAAAFPAARVEVRRVLLARPLVPTPASLALSATIEKHASAVFGEAIGHNGVPIYTDARLYAEAGIPVVLYGTGPRTIEDANGHRADERIRLSDLEKATVVIALVLAELLG